jgi:tetratricopeptide (TPR) repeat protein
VPSLAETITLRALGAGDIRGMVRTLLAAEVSEELFRMLVEKSEGNPLYVEEFLRQLQETEGIVVGDGEARLSRPDLTVPATIHDIIASRIDRLAEAHKRALQVASVVGRRFGVSLVSRILGVGPDEVTTHLRELHALDFVFPSAQDPELMYSFKHALTQDVVYAGVLERRRRMYHAAAALGLEDLYAGRIEDVVELVAYHFGRGHVWDKAVTYLRQAAAKAQARSGHREALAALEEALKMLRHLPETRERREQEIDVRLECRATLYPLGEFDKMLDYLREAGAIASAIPDPRRLGLVSIHIAEYYRQTGRFAEARRLAEQALEQGDKLQNLPLQLYASHYLGLACHALGDYRRACDVLRTVTTAPRFEWRTAAFVGMVVGSWEFFQSITLAWLARCLSERGEFGEAIAAGQRAVALAEETGGPYSVAAACLGLGYGYLVRGDLTAATPVLERSLNVAREGNVTLLRPQAARLLGCAFLRAGRIEEGAALARTAADEVEYRHLVMQQPAALAVLAEACLCFGDLEEAETAATLALTLAIERGQRGDAATAHYLLGKAAARESGDIATAEEHFRAGIALAEELDMRPLVAHSHLGLGKLYGRTDKRGQAHEHLTTATAMYREMGMTY